MEGQRRSKVARMMSKAEDDEWKDKRMTTRFQEQRRREENLRAVLNNHVVCENIASFLSLSDMKTASQVNPQFLQAMRGTKRFTKKAVLAITDKNLEDIKSRNRITCYKWRGVKVDVTAPTNILEDLPRVLKSAEFVSLEGRPWMIEDRAVEDAAAVSLLTAVLSSTPNLSQLKIDIRFLVSNVGGFLSSPAIKQTLMNLNRLELVKMTEGERVWEEELIFLNSDEEDAFWRNFGLLTGLPNRLKWFKLTELTPTEDQSVEGLHRPVLQLLKNNRATLEELELHFNVWRIHRIQELQTLTFPSLKALTVSVKWDENLCSGRRLGEFLKNQTSLEELTLTTMGGSVMPGDPLYLAVKECSVGLRKLHLTAYRFEQFDWRFLASMNRLKDFRLKIVGGFEPGKSLLTSLPKNQLEFLSLEGLGDTWGRLRGVANMFQFKTDLLQGFRCLRKLSFLKSWNAVDDQLMQWILQEFSLLEELQLSHCNELTDAGISGKTTAEWGRNASFADLRRLKTLKIVECDKVTPNGVLKSCVNLPCLKSVEYSNPGQIVESVVLELVEQNPRLERLSLHYDNGDLEKLRAKLMKMHPRVELLAENGDWSLVTLSTFLLARLQAN